MDRRKEKEERQKRFRVKWLLLLVFVMSTLLFYFFGTDLFSRLMVPRQEDEKVSLVFNGIPGNIRVIEEQGVLFVPVEWVTSHLLQEAELIEESEKIRWTPKTDLLFFSNPEVTEMVRRADFPLEINLLTVNETLYFPLQALQPLLNIEVVWFKEQALLVVDQAGVPWQQAQMDESTPLKKGRKKSDTQLTMLHAGDHVRILEIYEKHYRILTGNGFTGYVPQSAAGGVKRVTNPVHTNILHAAEYGRIPQPFGMVWDYVGGNHPNRSADEKIEALQVFSPTWFELKNEEGELENKGQFRYASTMKAKGYHLWGLVTNAFDPDLTESFMENEESRQRFTNQLLVYAALYELEGINIDFENIHYWNQDLFTDFVKELSEALRANGLTVSIDVTIPGGSLNWSQVYDRKAIEPHVDYVAVMTYDEHWSSSPLAGSVASIGWVERGIAATLEEVPPEKVLLGVPLYTRLWEESSRADGSISVTSRAMGMQFIRRTLEENGITEDQWEWLNDTGQYYAEYETEGKRYRVWLEDERSLALKATLIEKYGLAGFAAWRKDFEVPEVWETLGDLEQE